MPQPTTTLSRREHAVSVSGVQRRQQIAAIYAEHDRELHRLVRRRASQNPVIVQDACAHAWTQLLANDHVDLRPPLAPALAWLATTAIRHAWQLSTSQRRATPHPIDEIDALTSDRGQTAPASDELAVQHLRLELIAQIPERPRRYLLRLALGYSYTEIAAAEHASATTTNKQIARAKRILRQLETAPARGSG
jgi:DNA-directed RNA polymerase specialized sigma24 family protein